MVKKLCANVPFVHFSLIIIIQLLRDEIVTSTIATTVHSTTRYTTTSRETLLKKYINPPRTAIPYIVRVRVSATDDQ